MATESILLAHKLSLVYTEDQWGELCTFGVHTGARAEEDWGDVLSAFLEDVLTAIHPVTVPSHMVRATLSAWTTVGFTGWHQIAVLEDDRNFGTGADLPHQVALVVGVRNTEDVSIALGRRRNRSYLGPINTSCMDADGRFSTEDRDTLGAAWVDVSTALATVPAVDPDFNGLCVTSEAEGVIMTAQQVRIGKRFDTHRSRAEMSPEVAINYAL